MSRERQGTRKPHDLLLGKNSFCTRFPSEDIANHSYAPNSPLTDVLNTLSTEIRPTLLSLDHLYSPNYLAGLS